MVCIHNTIVFVFEVLSQKMRKIISCLGYLTEFLIFLSNVLLSCLLELLFICFDVLNKQRLLICLVVYDGAILEEVSVMLIGQDVVECDSGDELLAWLGGCHGS